MKRRLAVLLCVTLLWGCRDRSMPKNRVINQSTTVNDVLAEQTSTAEPTVTPEAEVQETTEPENPYETVDIDLTQSSETMLYSEVVDMGTNTENYEGQTIRIHGQYLLFHDDMSENSYPMVIVFDATKCCATGLVFDLSAEMNLPQEEQEFTVTGILAKQSSEDCPYPILQNAVISEIN